MSSCRYALFAVGSVVGVVARTPRASRLFIGWKLQYILHVFVTDSEPSFLDLDDADKLSEYAQLPLLKVPSRSATPRP